MGYEIALNMAWSELQKLVLPQKCSTSLFAANYQILIPEKEILRHPDGIQADEVTSLLILRFLIGKTKRGFYPSGEWISFKETDGGKLFWPNFSQRAIEPLAECFQQNPNGLIKNILENFEGKRVDGGDIAVEVETFPGVFVRLIFWRGEEQFPAEATMLFDRGLMEVYIMEDVAVLLTLLAEAVSKEC